MVTTWWIPRGSWDALRRGAGLRALAGEGRSRDRAGHRAQPHGRLRREPLVGGRARARADLRLRPRDGWYRRFFDIDDLAGVRVEDPAVFDAHPRQGPRARARRRDRRPARRPPRRARRPGGLPASACAPPALGTCGWRRSCTPRAAAGLARRGHRRLRVPRRRGGAVRRPGGRGGAHAAGRRPASRVRGRRGARPARAGGDDLRARGRAPARRCSTRRRHRRRRSRRCRSTAPTSSRGRARVEDADARGDRRRRRGRLADVLPLHERGRDEFVTRFQQTSPPVTAKGVEDTAFYRYQRLLALNEVGGDPARFGAVGRRVPRRERRRAERFPRSLLVTRRTTPSARATCARGSAR